MHGQSPLLWWIVGDVIAHIRSINKLLVCAQKVQESRLKSHGHACREEEYVGKRMVVMEVPGEEDRGEGGWIASATTCPRENCQGRKRKIGLNGGIDPHIKVRKDEEEKVCAHCQHRKLTFKVYDEGTIL